MNILVYGGGSVGLGIASCLIKSGEIVDIIARKDTAITLKENGLLRTGIFGHHLAEPKTFGSFTLFKELTNKKYYDYILVCVKSFDSYYAAKDISSHCRLTNKKTRIILFQNGWGNAETFCSFFPKEIIYNARVITGFCRPEKNHVDVTVHADAIHVGSLFNENLYDINNLCQSITDGGIPCKPTKDIGKDLWAKMLYNCALNPLGAILGVPYGFLGKLGYTRVIMKNVIKEIFDIINRYDYVTYWKCADDYLKDFYEKFLPPTAKHNSSMLQDIRAQKKTEIEALNGAVIQLGEKLKIQSPHNSTIYNMIKFLEEKNDSTSIKNAFTQQSNKANTERINLSA